MTKYFINGIGYGIEGYCCEEGDKIRATSDKPVNYTAIAIKGLLYKFKPRNATVTVDDVIVAVGCLEPRPQIPVIDFIVTLDLLVQGQHQLLVTLAQGCVVVATGDCCRCLQARQGNKQQHEVK